GASCFSLLTRAKATLRWAVGLLGLAFAAYYAYVVLAEAAQMPGAAAILADLAVTAHFAGEALAVLWTFALFWAVGPLAPRGEERTPWSRPRLAIAAVPAILIAIAPFFETWLQGVLVRMSLGFTLFLPPLVYAL